MESFNEKCAALPKDNITKENINKSLDNVFALNMPNGGLPVDEFLIKHNSYKNIVKINNTLLKLLNNGIIPMNNNNLYHCDIKDSNILIDSSSTLKARLIDWGLSTEYIVKKNHPFPRPLRNRPLQFNVPFSVIIYSDLFFEKYTKYIKEGKKIDHDNLKPFIIEYIILWLKKRGSGHYKFINQIMFLLFSNELDVNEKEKEKIIENEYTLNYIYNYIIEVLIHFTSFKEDGSINLRNYFDEVFIKITDIYGFIMAYLPIIESLFDNYSNLSEMELELFNNLKQIFIKYLYSPRIQPINVNELTNEFKELNKILNMSNNNYNNYNNNNSTNSKKSTSLKVSSSKRFKGITGQTYLLNINYKKTNYNI